ncbi:MAG TPA: hypothetical protein VFB45_19030 [Pseudolabrys sp.]|nr:hypothetical protein [Pseudolabrys sp.]
MTPQPLTRRVTIVVASTVLTVEQPIECLLADERPVSNERATRASSQAPRSSWWDRLSAMRGL